MKSLQLDLRIPRYLFSKAVGRWWPTVYAGPLGCLRYHSDAPEPELPGPDWVKLRTVIGGVCGSDVGGVTFRHRWDTCYTRFTSFPMAMGHENVCRVAETGPDVAGFEAGQRVMIDPILGCAPRGIDPPCRNCREGHPSTCEHFLDGPLKGTTIGNNRVTGGSWSEFFVAHKSQVHPVDDRLTDEQAVLLDPFSSAVHAVLRTGLPGDDDTVLVLGGGCMGLCTVAALRGLGFTGRLVVVGRHGKQVELADRFGADLVLTERGGRLWKRLASELDARLLRSTFGFNRYLVGGAGFTYDTVCSSETMELALKCTRGQGTIGVVGMGYPRGFDFMPVWFKELTIKGCLSTGRERWRGREVDTTDIAQELVTSGKVDITAMITHRHPIENYRQALRECIQRGRSGQVKTVFVFGDRR